MRYGMVLTGLVLSSVLSACGTSSCLKDVDKDTFAVTLERGACFGKCPVFVSTVYGDGRVEFDGRANVNRMGIYETKLDDDQRCELVKAVDESEVLTADFDKALELPDAPRTRLTVRRGSTSRTLEWYVGTPARLKPLVAMFEQMAVKNDALHPR